MWHLAGWRTYVSFDKRSTMILKLIQDFSIVTKRLGYVKAHC